MAEFTGDDQDVAETLDETNLTEDGDDIVNMDEIPDVFDVTSAIGDADEDEASDEDLESSDEDPDLDDSPLTRLEDRPDNEAVVVDDPDRVSGPGDEPSASGTVTSEDSVTTEDKENPNRFESPTLSEAQLRELGYKR